MENVMLKCAAVSFVIAIIAAVLGFGGIAGGAIEAVKLSFFFFVAIFVATLVLGLGTKE